LAGQYRGGGIVEGSGKTPGNHSEGIQNSNRETTGRRTLPQLGAHGQGMRREGSGPGIDSCGTKICFVHDDISFVLEGTPFEVGNQSLICEKTDFVVPRVNPDRVGIIEV